MQRNVTRVSPRGKANLSTAHIEVAVEGCNYRNFDLLIVVVSDSHKTSAGCEKI
jgi:hypothetical protein